jgi:hypothetical protein
VKITLHPKMTAEQIAKWCDEHKMFVCIDYPANGEPKVEAYPEQELMVYEGSY